MITIPHFIYWCRQNDIAVQEQDIEDVKLVCEKSIIDSALRSNNQHLIATTFEKLLTKYHNYGKANDFEKIPPITITISEREDAKIIEPTVGEELAKMNNRFN